MSETTTTRKPRAAKAAAPEEEPVQATEAAPDLNIYQRIAAISREAGALAPESKGGVPFAFRGIDGTVAHLTPYLNKYGVFSTPNVTEHTVTEREIYTVHKATGEMLPSGRIVKTTKLQVEFTFFGPDGDSVVVTTPGLADDFADRSTAQAMSVAYRLALLQLFHLPTHSKEPEETGQAVLDGAGADAPAAPRGPKAVEAAKDASAPAATPVSRLQQQAKALGRKLNKEAAELNAMGSELSGGKEQAEWFNDAVVMGKLVEKLEAEAKA